MKGIIIPVVRGHQSIGLYRDMIGNRLLLDVGLYRVVRNVGGERSSVIRSKLALQQFEI